LAFWVQRRKAYVKEVTYVYWRTIREYWKRCCVE